MSTHTQALAPPTAARTPAWQHIHGDACSHVHKHSKSGLHACLLLLKISTHTQTLCATLMFICIPIYTHAHCIYMHLHACMHTIICVPCAKDTYSCVLITRHTHMYPSSLLQGKPLHPLPLRLNTMPCRSESHREPQAEGGRRPWECQLCVPQDLLVQPQSQSVLGKSYPHGPGDASEDAYCSRAHNSKKLQLTWMSRNRRTANKFYDFLQSK